MAPTPVASASGQPFEYERVLRDLTRRLIPPGKQGPEVGTVLYPTLESPSCSFQQRGLQENLPREKSCPLHASKGGLQKGICRCPTAGKGRQPLQACTAVPLLAFQLV